MTTRGDWEKYQSGRPNKLMRAVLVSYVSEQRVLRMLPPFLGCFDGASRNRQEIRGVRGG